MGVLGFGVMDLDTTTMVEGLTLTTTTSPFPCRFPTPSNAVQPALPVPLGFPVIAPGRDDSHENELLNSLTFLLENPVQPAHTIPLAFPAIVPGSADSREAAVDIKVYHCIHEHANEFLLRETAKSLGVEPIGELRPFTGCFMAQWFRRPIAHSTKSRATEKLKTVFVDLSSPKRTHSLLGKKYVKIVKDDFTRYIRIYFFERNAYAADVFSKC